MESSHNQPHWQCPAKDGATSALSAALPLTFYCSNMHLSCTEESKHARASDATSLTSEQLTSSDLCMVHLAVYTGFIDASWLMRAFEHQLRICQKPIPKKVEG